MHDVGRQHNDDDDCKENLSCIIHWNYSYTLQFKGRGEYMRFMINKSNLANLKKQL
jgi:hypothetical protein